MDCKQRMRRSTLLFVVVASQWYCESVWGLVLKKSGSSGGISRRQAWKKSAATFLIGTNVLSSSPGQGVAATDTTGSSISSRFDSIILKKPAVSSASELNGIDNTYYPDFLQGTWDVTQTLVNVQTPLGLMFAGGPNGSEQIAAKSMEESKSQINKPVKLQLRYVPTVGGVAEDRLFNTRQRLDNFAGRSVVASINYADTGGSNRASVKAMGGTDEDPLTTTLVRFKGPAAQKTFVTAHGFQYLNAEKTAWAGYETNRSLFALTNESTAPPITTDSELLFQFEKIDDTTVRGKFRIAGYLNPNDKLYFEARNRAVTIQDYTLELKRIS